MVGVEVFVLGAGRKWERGTMAASYAVEVSWSEIEHVCGCGGFWSRSVLRTMQNLMMPSASC